MQPIERYGVISLLFLIVTIVAVLLWDGDASSLDDVVAAKESGGRTAPAEPRETPREVRQGEAGLRPAKVVAQPEPETQSRKAPRRQRRPGAGGRARGVEEEDSASLRSRPQGAGLTSAVTKERQQENARRLEAERLERARAAEEDLRQKQREEEAARLAAREAEQAARTPEPLPESRTVPVTTQKRESQRPTRGASKGSTTYTIQPGDVLSKISQDQLGTIRRMNEIVALNPGLDPDRLIVGREIRLPADGVQGNAPRGASPAPKVSRPSAPKGTKTDGKTFRVRPGDSLWKIADYALGKGERWKEIARLNPDVDPNKLSVGQELVLPTGATVASEQARSRPVVASGSGQPTKSKGQKRGKVR